MSAERVARLARYLERIAPGGPDAWAKRLPAADAADAAPDAAPAPDDWAFVGPQPLAFVGAGGGSSAAEGQAKNALEAWRALAAGAPVRGAGLGELEAIVHTTLRPMPVIVDGAFDPLPDPWAHLERHRPSLLRAIAAVGRLEVLGHPRVPYAGTAFFVGPRLMMTNRHVAGNFLVGQGNRRFRYYQSIHPGVDMRRELIPSEPELLWIVGARLVHPHWDLALVEVDRMPAGVEPLELLAAEPSGLAGRDVVVIGYPTQDARNLDAELQERLFGGAGGIKRLQPGRILGYAGYDGVEALAHDASTAGGNSGSLVFDPLSGAVLGLHFAGEYLVSNYAVPAWELARDPRVVDAGVRFRGSAPPGPEPPWLSAWSALAASQPDAVAPLRVPADRQPAPAVSVSLQLGGDAYERLDDGALVAALAVDPEGCAAFLRETLGADADDALVAFQAPAASVAADAPYLLLVPDLFGSHLVEQDAGATRRWLGPARFEASTWAALTFSGEAPGLRPAGPLRLLYADALRTWRAAGFPAGVLDYDWRRSVEHSADRLHHRVESLWLADPGRKIVLVGHGMGGLVACAYAQRHATWAERVQRAVLLGVPLRGLHAAVELLHGRGPVLGALGGEDPAEAAAAARSWAGLVDLLPDPVSFPEAERLYQAETWGEGPPRQAWLDASRRLKEQLLASPLLARAVAWVGLDLPSPASLEFAGGSMGWGAAERAGDGLVAAAACAADGLNLYGLPGAHFGLPRRAELVAWLRDAENAPAPVRGDVLNARLAPVSPSPVPPLDFAGRLRRAEVDRLFGLAGN